MTAKAPFAALYQSAAKASAPLEYVSASQYMALLEGQGNVETGGTFNPTDQGRDVSQSGQVSYDNGLAQINSAAHPTVTLAQAQNPAFAIPWQARYLSGLIRQYGGVQQGLEAYNSGSPTGAPGYAKKVITAAQTYGYSGQGAATAFGILTQTGLNALAPGLGAAATAYSLGQAGANAVTGQGPTNPATVLGQPVESAASTAYKTGQGVGSELANLADQVPKVGEDVLIGLAALVLLALGLYFVFR